MTEKSHFRVITFKSSEVGKTSITTWGWTAGLIEQIIGENLHFSVFVLFLFFFLDFPVTLYVFLFPFVSYTIGVGRGGGGRPPYNLRGGPTYPLGPPTNNQSTHIFLQFLCETGKNHKGTKLKGRIIVNVTLI